MRVNIHPAAILRARGLGDNTAARRHLAATIARLSDPYVPMQQGILKNTCVIETEGREIEYRQPYAHYQYYGEVMAGRAPKQYTGELIRYHGAPMRGSAWDKRMMADRGDEVADDLAAFVGGRRV